MGEYMVRAQENGRNIPKEDMIFGVSSRANQAIAAKGAENVINGTVGMLLDDQGKPIVLSSVDRVLHDLRPEEYVPYAPIGGTEGYRKAVLKAAFRDLPIRDELRVVAAPGGTGALMMAIVNYTKIGDKVLTADWHWGPYGKIAEANGRGISYFRLLNEEETFDVEDFRRAVGELLAEQDSLLVILNTPGNNPTGYGISVDEWKKILDVLKSQPKEKSISLVVDTAYIDFAGDEDEVRKIFPLLDGLPENVLAMLAYSFSKTFTIYGVRTGALVCYAKDQEQADEFSRVCEYSARAAWSNSPRIGQSIIERIYADDALLKKVTEERAEIRGLLLKRGQVLTEEAARVGLETLPYQGGFFSVIPCSDPQALGRRLEQDDVFLVPFGRGLRVSIAALSEEKCRVLPTKVLEAMRN